MNITDEMFPNWREECLQGSFWESLISKAIIKMDDRFNEEPLHTCAMTLNKINFEAIIKRSESPIEAWLMTWTYFAFFMYNPFSMIVENTVNINTIFKHLETRGTIKELVGDDDEKIWDAAKEMLTKEEYVQFLIASLYDYDELFIVVPQANGGELNPLLKQMRFDYLIYQFQAPATSPKALVIECDGYEYHKESFIQDRKRDRAIRASDFEIMRFSGSEIYADPIKISLDILEYFTQAKTQ